MDEVTIRGGQDFSFDNEDWCVRNNDNDEDMRGGFLTWNERHSMFLVFFNGACVHTSLTFKSAKRKVAQLMAKWNCEATERCQA